mmetsp:Transcript_83854/g.218307  ORF Transcript_83854/g.218307 Transcript_83854/m.218307 type:complete len:324 (+) Transcript_83854:430-1401(+)
MVVEEIRAHDLRVAIRMRQHEDICQLVQFAAFIRELCFPALRVVIVQEDDRLVSRHQTPLLPEGAQVLELTIRQKIRSQVPCIVELRHVANAEIHVRTHSFVRSRDDLVEYVQVLGQRQDYLTKLPSILVFRRVHPDAGDAERRQSRKVGADVCLDARASRAEVREADQIAILHVVLVCIIVDSAVVVGVATIVVHVLLRIDRRRPIPIRLPSDAHAGSSSNMVDDGVRVDADPSIRAASHHVDEPSHVPRAAGEVVRHWLVPSPPGTSLDVLIRRGDLHCGEAFRAEPRFALLGHVRPRPLEQVHERRTWRCRPPRPPRQRQ